MKLFSGYAGYVENGGAGKVDSFLAQRGQGVQVGFNRAWRDQLWSGEVKSGQVAPSKVRLDQMRPDEVK